MLSRGIWLKASGVAEKAASGLVRLWPLLWRDILSSGASIEWLIWTEGSPGAG